MTPDVELHHEMNPEARNWAMLCHLAGLAKWTAIPLANILAPFVLWQMKKDQFPLVDHQGKESVNFQISMTLYLFLAALLCFVVVGFAIVPLLIMADVLLIALAAVKAHKGEYYRYPVTIRFLP